MVAIVTTMEDLTVVDAVALRRFNEATMIRVLAAAHRRETGYGPITKKRAREIARRVAGDRSLARVTDALVAEVARQNDVLDARLIVRAECEDLDHYDPVKANERNEGDYSNDGHFRSSRLGAIFDHRMSRDGFEKILPSSYSYSTTNIDIAIVAKQVVALIEPQWRCDANGKTQRRKVTRFLVVAPRTPRGKPRAVKVAPETESVDDAIESVMPSAVVAAINALTLGLGHPPHLYSGVELDWKGRRFGVWHMKMRKWHPFRKVGITPEGASKLGWAVIRFDGPEWLRVLA